MERHSSRYRTRGRFCDTNPHLATDVSVTKMDESERCYFESYARTSIHGIMLKDSVRTDSYKNAIYHNKHLFKNKVVLDVGCGTGILSLFAAKAGARRVFGIEMSDFAHLARKVVLDNKLDNVIKIIKGKVEEVILPVEKVDVIVSEWMGYCLFYESMLDSVLYARDKWLVPAGVIFPDIVKLYVFGMKNTSFHEKTLKYVEEKVYDDYDVSCLSQLALREPQVGHLAPEQMVTSSFKIKEFDLTKDSVEDTEFKSDFTLTMEKSDTLSGFATYFDTIFSQCHRGVMFTTSPLWKSTHWSQTAFYLRRGYRVNGKDEITGSFKMKKNGEYFRDLDFELSFKYKNEFDNIDEKNNYTLRY